MGRGRGEREGGVCLMDQGLDLRIGIVPFVDQIMAIFPIAGIRVGGGRDSGSRGSLV